MTRIGLIADIHGNAVALRRVLHELATGTVDRIVCLGDAAVLGPEPGTVVELLVGAECDLVQGNTDAWLFDAPSDAIPPSPGPAADLLAWTRRVLESDHLEFLRQASFSLRLSLDDGSDVLCVHGSPVSFEDVIGPQTPEPDVIAMMGGKTADILVGGHTHLQTVRPFDRMVYVNPGSVGLPGVGPGTPGLPVNRGPRWAEFAILESGSTGRRIELRRIPLDLAKMIEAAREADMPHLDWWRSRWG